MLILPHLSIQFVDAGFANQTVPVAYSLHFGCPGVSQYINVHDYGLPSFTLQLLHPSK